MRQAERACPICTESESFDHRLHHEGIGNVAPADLHSGSQYEIRKQGKNQNLSCSESISRAIAAA